MVQQNSVEVVSLMKRYQYLKNMRGGQSSEVYTKIYYNLTIAFDYRKVNKDIVIMYVYDNLYKDYVSFSFNELFDQEVITILDELNKMGLELIIK